MSVIAQFKDICAFPTTVFVFESYLKGDTLLILFICYHNARSRVNQSPSSSHNGSERLLGTLDVKGTIIYVFI